MNRQIGLLIHRSGQIETLIVGTFNGIMIPQLNAIRASGGRLRGLRLVHTHPGGEDISDEDLMDLLFLRLDLLSVLKMTADGLPERLYSVHLLPDNSTGQGWIFLPPVHPANQTESFEDLITSLEAEFSRSQSLREIERQKDRAILVSVSTEPKLAAEESLTELVELARSDNVAVLDTVLQRLRKVNPRLILGKGKLA